jgi:hypothetical protein
MEEPSMEEEHGPPAGLSLSENGLTLVPERRGAPQAFVFRVVAGDGRTVRRFDVAHERPMHLVVVRRDLTGFQHLHPRQREDGSWATQLTLPAAGVHRAFADFERAGERTTLGVDVTVAGTVVPHPLPAPRPVATTGAYRVSLDRTGPTLRFRFMRDGEPFLPDPHLGARGHLVVLREGDLAYVHAHDEPGASAANGTAYEVELPSAGRYALFLQFAHGGSVHTVPFTLEERP